MPFIEKTSSGKRIAIVALPLGEVIEKDGIKYLTLSGSEIEGVNAGTGNVMAIKLVAKPVLIALPEFTEVSWHKKARFQTKDASEIDYKDAQKIHDAMMERETATTN